ncbi:MAG: tetratricopeptide repeat protein [Nitrospirales bacterium]
MRGLKFLFLISLCLVVGAGCARTRPHSPPGPPVTESFPPVVSEDMSVPIPEPFTEPEPEKIRQIHHQMMSEAQTHFAKEELAKAIQDLQRLLALRPNQELEFEGRWMLAQAYRKTGEWKDARDQYQVLASTPDVTPYQHEAKRNFQELEALLEESRRPPQDTQAIRLSFSQLPESEGFDEGIKRMRGDGVTTLLIDLGCEVRSKPKPDSHASVPLSSLETMQAMLRSFVTRSHLQNLLVYIGVSPRCVGFWKEPAPVEWHDRSYDLQARDTIESRLFDLFHPQYQRFLLHFLDQVAEAGVDGIIFLGDQPMGPYDGLAPTGIEAFQQAFQTRFIVSEVFRQPIDLGQLRKPILERSVSGNPSIHETLFWRWVGWKARERLVVLEQMFHHLRRRHLTLQVGLELHPHGLTDPVRALVEYTEDSMEATRRPFSFFYVRPEIDRQSASNQKQALEKLRRISMKAVLSRLLPILDDPRRVWVSSPADGRKRVSPGTGQESTIMGEYPAGIGVVHDLRAFS